VKYKHTNIVAKDWRRLAEFYSAVFACVPVPPERNLSGDWLSKGTGVPHARFTGVHLRLPGCGENGPTFEIYQYATQDPRTATAANREGLAHLAFEVEDVAEMTAQVIRHDGRKVGEIATAQVPGVGMLTFIYVADPEGNIIELQAWKG